MPSDTLDAPDVHAPASARAACASITRRAIGLEYWVFNLAPRVTSRVHKEVVQDRAIRTALAWAIDRSEARAGLAPRLRRAGQHAALAQLRRLHARPLEGSDARLPLRPGAGEAHPRPGRLEGRPRRHPPQPDGVRAALRARLRGPSDREARGHADPRVGARRRHRRSTCASTTPTSSQPRVQQGRQEAHARLRHRALVDRRRPDARVPALALHEGADRRLERLGLRRPDVRAALQAGDARDRPSRRASTRSTSCSASPPRKLPYIELYEADDLGAVNTRTWQNWTTQPSPDGQPITSYGYDTIIALQPGALASSSYPGVPWALAGLVALAVLALGLVVPRAPARASASRSRSRTRPHDRG